MAVALDTKRSAVLATPAGGAASTVSSATAQASPPQGPNGTTTQSSVTSGAVGADGQSSFVSAQSSTTQGPNGTTMQGSVTAATSGAPGSNGQSSFVSAQASLTQGPNGTTLSLSATAAGPGGWQSINVISQLNPQGPQGKDFEYKNGIYNCGGAVAAMVARGLGSLGHLSDAELITQLGAGLTDENGTSLKGMGKMLERAGAKLGGDVLTGGYEDSMVKQHLEQGNKLIARVGITDKNTGKTDGHYVLIDGMDDKGNYIVKDPLKEQSFTVTPEELREAIDKAPGAGGALIPVGAPRPGQGGEYRSDSKVLDRFDKDNKILPPSMRKLLAALDPFKVDAQALEKSGKVDKDFDESVADTSQLDSQILKNDALVDNDIVGAITSGSEDGGEDTGQSITGRNQPVEDMVAQVLNALSSEDEADNAWGRWLLESLEQSRGMKDRQVFRQLQEQLSEMGGVGARMWLESLN